MSEINRRGIIEILSWHCLICNYFEERGKGTLCGQRPPEIVNGKIVEYDECIFCRNSAPVAGSPSRVGLKHSVFRPLGLTARQCQNWGPHQLFMFLFYTELNWQNPPVPPSDNYGYPVNQETARQTIHHLNNDHFDNRKDNITWNLISDHTRNGQLTKKLRDHKIADAKKNARELRIRIPRRKMDRR